MKITIMLIMLSVSAATIAGIIETEQRPRQSVMTIKYEDHRGVAVMAIQHPTGITCFHDIKDLQAQEAEVLQRIADAQAELAVLRSQIKGIEDKAKEVNP